MNKFEFEYVHGNYGGYLMLFSFLSFFLILFIGVQLKDYLNFYVIMLISLIIPFLIYRTNRKKAKKVGKAIIGDDYTEITKFESVEKIMFSEIKNYQVYFLKGTTTLLINLKNGKKTALGTNPDFCDTINFELYCFEFEKNIENYLRLNNLEMIKTKSVFDRKWLYSVLLIITIFTLICTVNILIRDGKIPFFIIVVSYGPLLSVWSSYFYNKRKSKILKINNK